MVLPIVSVLIGISLMYYIRQKRAETEMDEIVSSISPSNDGNEILVLETCALSCFASLIVKFV